MHRGTMIDELIATVERVEQTAHAEAAPQAAPVKSEVFVPYAYSAAYAPQLVEVA
ncbi:MAG TPA: hypothetical protein VNK82_09950 [Terriglobales bacterium]|nr:hypothetical protein [Terriglobales bacterium]